MNIPLLRQVMADKRVRILPRAIDRHWAYENIVPYSMVGFNPFSRVIYIARESALGQWMAGGMRDDRRYNESDLLTYEVLFLIHDYLHCWGYMAIQDEMPELQFGVGEITSATLETHVFCHLLTEAVATVGLDYWYLSTVDLGEVCGIGSPRSRLTVSYHERDLAEYRRADPDFSIQDVGGFERIARFYCTGEFLGFGLDDMKRSAKIHQWLRHELSYGERQREYIRRWLCHLSSGRVHVPEAELRRALPIGAGWQKKLMARLAERLWAMVKGGESATFRRLPKLSSVWKTPRTQRPDFRFTNLNRLEPGAVRLPRSVPDFDEQFVFLFSQFVSSFSFRHFPKELLGLVILAREGRDLDSLRALFRVAKARPVLGERAREPVDLFFLN